MPPTGTRSRADERSGWHPRPGQHTSILFDVFELGQRVRTLLATAMRDAGIRPDEYAAYSVVFENERITATELARALGMPVTTAADYVRAMTARGHLSKQPHPTDNRAHLLVLTPTGRQAHQRASACFERAYQAFVRELPPHDESTARALLHHLADCAARAADAV